MATDTATPADNKIVKPVFKPEVQFNFKGPSGETIPIQTAEVSRGKTQGTVYHRPNTEALKYEELPKIWDAEDLMEEIIRPALNKLSLAVSKIARKKNTNNEGDFDFTKYQEDFVNLLSRLTLQSESVRALKLKVKELMTKLSDLAGKMPGSADEFTATAMEIAKINSQIEEANASKEVVDDEEETEADTTPATA